MTALSEQETAVLDQPREAAAPFLGTALLLGAIGLGFSRFHFQVIP